MNLEEARVRLEKLEKEVLRLRREVKIREKISVKQIAALSSQLLELNRNRTTQLPLKR